MFEDGFKYFECDSLECFGNGILRVWEASIYVPFECFSRLSELCISVFTCLRVSSWSGYWGEGFLWRMRERCQERMEAENSDPS
jgi:hypothetical protein